MVVGAGNSLKPSTTISTASATIKFLCSYGGKIVPGYPDGKLRYLGGETRVLAVDRSISFSELLLKLRELCRTSVILRCQFPAEDLDTLVSITSDEELASIIDEYEHQLDSSSSLKIRAFLSLPKSIKRISPPISPSSSTSSSPKSSSPTAADATFTPRVSNQISNNYYRSFRQIPLAINYPTYREKCTLKSPRCAYHAYGNPSPIHNGNYWQ